MNAIAAEAQQWIALVGALFAILSPGALWWLSKTFAAKADVKDLRDAQARMERRLGDGDTRFAKMDMAIKEATKAADEAKDAAERAIQAADKIGDMRVNLAELRGDIRTLTALLGRVERDADLLVHGHMTTAT